VYEINCENIFLGRIFIIFWGGVILDLDKYILS